MSTERSRTIVILVIIALIAGGAGFWFFKIYTPSQNKKAAQAEVATWEIKFAAARACLLGPTPGSVKTSEALAMRELSPDPWDRAGCSKLMATLNRGEADDTGNKAIETAWQQLDRAATKAAGAFATHITSTDQQHDPLPAALDDLDAARANLRAITGLPATTQRGEALKPVQLVPITTGSAQLTSIALPLPASAHGVVAAGGALGHGYQVVLRTGTTPVVTSSDEGMHAVPDPSWGAQLDGDTVAIGPFDARGVLAGDTTAHLATPLLLAVVGTQDRGTVVYENATQLVISRTTHAPTANALVATPEASIAHLGVARAGVDVDGRAAVVWLDAKHTSHGRILSSTGEAAIDLVVPELSEVCLTSERAWMAGAQLVSFGAGKTTATVASRETELLGCTNEAALFEQATFSDEAKTFTICQTECRTAVMPKGAPASATVTAIGNKLVAVAARGSVLGVWREDLAPVFYGLPEPLELGLGRDVHPMAMTNGVVLDAIAKTPKGFAIVRVPVK